MTDLLSEKDTKVVHEILAQELEVSPSQLTPDARFQEDLGADSLTITEITMALEDRFQLTIPDTDVENVQTVRDLFELLGKLITKG